MNQEQRGERESSSNGTAARAREFSWADWHSLTMPLLELPPLARSDNLFYAGSQRPAMFFSKAFTAAS